VLWGKLEELECYKRVIVRSFNVVPTVKPDELVQLKPFEETDCLKSFKFINSNN